MFPFLSHRLSYRSTQNRVGNRLWNCGSILKERRFISIEKEIPLKRKVSSELNETICKVFPQLKGEGMIQGMSRVEVNKRGGEYQTPVALSLSRKLSLQPKEIGKRVVQQLEADKRKEGVIERGEFHEESGQINLFLNSSILSQRIHRCASLRFHQLKENPSQSAFALQKLYEREEKKRVLIDFGSPNMCKELHVGHLRSILLGDSIARTLEYLGHDVERISHVGDFGTPVALVLCHAFDSKLPFALSSLQSNSQILSNPQEWPSPSLLSSIYVEAKERSKTDPDFFSRAKQIAKQMQNIETAPEHIQNGWKVLCEASRMGFEKIFDRLGVTAEERGESHYASLLSGVISELESKGLATLSDGAICVFLPNQKVPFLIQKSDGAYLYATTDLAALKSRIESGKEWIIYVTDDSQSRHFDQLFKIGKMAGWLDTTKTRVDHVPFGVMKGTDGKKLSSRDGSPYPLETLLNESISSVTTKPELLEGRTDISEKELVERIAFNAIKYFDLCHGRDYIFSHEAMLSLKGNTAVYLMYAYARISSIKAQFASRTGKEYQLNKDFVPVFQHSNEISLALWASRFPEVLENLESGLSPQVLCEYLYELASQFHSFYSTCQVLDNTQQESRMQLCLAVEAVLETGLHLLGLKTSSVI